MATPVARTSPPNETTTPDVELTDVEQKLLAAHVPGANRAKEPFGWDANTKALCATVSRIKAEAVQAERARVAQECEKRADNVETLGWTRGANAYRHLARFVLQQDQ